MNLCTLSTADCHWMRRSPPAPSFPASLMGPLASWFLLARLP